MPPESPTVDISEQERARLGALAQAFRDDSWEWDLVTGELVSAHAHELSGMGGRIDSDALRSMLHADDRPRLVAAMQEIRDGKRDRFQLEVRLPRWDNRWATVLMRGAVISRDDRGVANRIAGSSLDVTDRVERLGTPPTSFDERQLAGQKLESLGLLAGGIAHDFNNLLMAVVAEATLAKDEQGLTPTTREALDRIEVAGRRMADLTGQLLAYAGRGRFVVEKVDPDATVQDLATLLRRSIRRDARFVVELGGGAPVIEADPTQLRQVVMNLVINASDALGPGGGAITVRTRVDHGAAPPAWTIEVSDDGHGMDAATRERMFDPFYTTKVNGHGLGLSAVLGIVNKMSGTIVVDSAPGAGARVTVRVPAQPGVAPVVAARPIASAALLAGRRALVADDEDSVRMAVRRMLERRGAVVTAVVDGREARAALAREPFDVVFLDVNMPAGGAYDLLPDVRGRKPAPKVVIMSGYSESFSAKPGALRDDGDGFLQKPFSLAQLDAALRGLFT